MAGARAFQVQGEVLGAGSHRAGFERGGIDPHLTLGQVFSALAYYWEY